MEQHPVPQQISSYEFRLVGDMTLKQFSYLAGGVIIALVFYSTPIPGIFKWFLVGLSAFTGFAFAFMPIEERPLTTWIIAFLKSVFSPTMYVWQKKGQKPELFQTIKPAPAVPKPAPDKAKINTYPKALPVETKLSQINQLFQTAKIPASQPVQVRQIPWPKQPEKPSRNNRPRMAAKTTNELPIPDPPTQPNIIVGMVLDKKGQMIEGAILEIRNSQGMPVRALRTNKLGQFRIATPLGKEVYEIETEKEGYVFNIIKIEAKGEIIKPIEIRAK